MRRTEQRQGLRMLKLREVLSRWEGAGVSQVEAAELLGMSERTFRRWTRRFEEEGEDGLMDRRLGRRSGRAVPVEEAEEVERLYRERYAGFTAKHFHEHLVEHHGFHWGYTWTKTYLQARGFLAKAARRGAHRRKRPRRPMVGMMLHQDASRHAWLEGHGPLDLVVTLDDATSEIYSAFLVEEEGTVSSVLGLIETIAAKGLCLTRSTPTAAAIISIRPRRAGRSLRAPSPKSAERLRNWGSSPSPPIHPRRVDAPSAPFARFRIACPRSWPWPA
jgi:transposase